MRQPPVFKFIVSFACLLIVFPFIAKAQTTTITSVTAPVNGYYTNGQTLDFTIYTSAPVTVNTTGGTPYFNIVLDTGLNAKANYVSGSGTNSLVFTYTVQGTHSDYNGIQVASSIEMNGGLITDGNSNNLVSTFSIAGSLSGILVDGILPKLIYNQPEGSFPTTRQSIPFKLKFNKPVTGITLNSFEVVTSPSIVANVTSFYKVNDTVYKVLVSDQTPSSSYTGTVKLNIKSSAVASIKDLRNQVFDNTTITIGTSGEINFPMTITIQAFQPTPRPFAGGIVEFLGLNLARVDKVLIGNVPGKILSNNDSSMFVLVMPGSDTTLATLKIVRGQDTVYPVFNQANYTAYQSKFPTQPIGKLTHVATNQTKNITSFAIEKNGIFAVICNAADNNNAGSCALFRNSYATNMNGAREGWVQSGQKFTHPSGLNTSYFGTAVNISAGQNRLAIVARDGANSKGQIIIYNIDKIKLESNSIFPIDSILKVDAIIDGNEVGSVFGNSIELSADGNTLVIAAPGKNNSEGAVYIYNKEFDGWNLSYTITKPNDAIGSNVMFGSTIALSANGENLFVGTPNDNQNKGAVWAYKYNNNAWGQFGSKISTPGAQVGAGFASSIAVSANGNKVIIGAPGVNTSKGAVYYYKLSNNTYAQYGDAVNDTTSDPTSNFGASISMTANGDLFTVAAPNVRQGAYFFYGLKSDSVALLYSKINNSVDTFYGYNHVMDYQGNGLLHEISYANGDKNIGALDGGVFFPTYRSLDTNFINRNTSDTLIAKLFYARSVHEVLYADTIRLNFQALSDTTILVVMDSTIMESKNRLNFKYGVVDNFSDSITIDKILPTVTILPNTTRVGTDSLFRIKLRFSEKIATNILTAFPLLPNANGGIPSARLDSVKQDTANLVYTAYYKAMSSGPIFFFNESYGAFYDTLGNQSMPIANSDTIIFDNVTQAPLLFLNKLSLDTFQVNISVPENFAPNSLKLTFLDPVSETEISTWTLSNTYTVSNLVSHNLNKYTDPVTLSFVSAVTPSGHILNNNNYKVKLSYQDHLLNPTATSSTLQINLRNNPSIITYSPDTTNRLRLITFKGTNFLLIDSVKISNKKLTHTVSNDSIFTIQNLPSIGSGFVNLYFNGDSSVLDSNFNILDQGSNFQVTIQKTWQKFRNIHKGKLNDIRLKLSNASSTIDNRLVLELHKDTSLITSLDPSIKFNNIPLAISDTITLLKNTTSVYSLFNFSDTSIILNDSTDYFFIIKQLNEIGSPSNKIFYEINNTGDGAVNGVKYNLTYRINTKPFLYIDTIPPSVTIILNKNGAFNDPNFQVKLRFNERVTGDIINHFPLYPSLRDTFNLARLDSVKADTVGLVYTGYFSAINNGSIFFFNPNFGAFADVAGNLSLPILGSDTIIYDNVTIPPLLYVNPVRVTDSILFDILIPESPAPNSIKLTIYDQLTDSLLSTWTLSNTLTNTNRYTFPYSINPTSIPYVTDVSPLNFRLVKGKYKIKVFYRDLINNAFAFSAIWNFEIKDSLPLVYTYSPTNNARSNELMLNGYNFSLVDSVKIGQIKVAHTILNDSVLKITDKFNATTGLLNLFFKRDSTINKSNVTQGSENANTEVIINKPWQQFYNLYKGKLNNINLKLSNTSLNVDNDMIVEVFRDTIVTNSLDPAQKFNNDPILISDTFRLLRNTPTALVQFNFTDTSLVIEDSTHYYFVLKQLNHNGIHSSKITTSLNNYSGSNNNVRLGLFYQVNTKPFIIFDSIPPSATIINNNRNKLVTGPFYVDVAFSESVEKLTLQNPPLLPQLNNGLLSARIDSVVAIVPNRVFRQYMTPLVKGKIELSNYLAGITRDWVGFPSIFIGADTVRYIGDDFSLDSYNFPYARPENIIEINGKGFTYLEHIKLNNQIVSKTIVNDSLATFSLTNTFIGGKISLFNYAGDSIVDNKFQFQSSTTTQAILDNQLIQFKPKSTGVLDSLHFYFTNNNSILNENVYLTVYDKNLDLKYNRIVAISDTIQIQHNEVDQLKSFKFKPLKDVLLKDSTYYLSIHKIAQNSNDLLVKANSNGNPLYNYSLIPYLLIDTLPVLVNFSNNAVNGIVNGQYQITFNFNKPLRYVGFPLMLPAVDSNNNLLARVDSTVISNDGLTYRQFVTPLKQGKVLFFNANFGTGYDYYGYMTPPFGFDSVTFINTNKPFIKQYNVNPVSTGRVIDVVGKNLTNVRGLFIGNTPASLYVKNDDTLTFISPLNTGSGRIQLIDFNNDTVQNLVDTFYNAANTFKIAHEAWQEFVIPRTGLIHKLGIQFQNTSSLNAQFQLKIYKKDNAPSSLLPSLKFETPVLVSDTLLVNAGTQSIKYFTFKKQAPIVALDSHFYFVLHQLDENQNIQIKTDLTIEQGHSLKGSAGGVAAKLYHSLEMESYLIIDTIKPVPVLKVQKQVVAGPFYVDLTYSKPVNEYDPNPIVVDAFNNLPKATLDSTKVIAPGLKFRYYYKPVTNGPIKFIIPNQFAAIDFAGNGSDISNLATAYVVDTTIKNVVRALGELSVCAGDSVQLFTAIDSALDFEWNTLSTQRFITTTTSGSYFIRIKIDSNLYYNSDTLHVVIRPNPIAPTLSRTRDLLVSSAKTNNKWYKNNTLLIDTTQSLKPTASAMYTVRKMEEGCLSEPSSAYSFTYANIDSLKGINILGATSICKGDSVILTYANNSFKQFKWSTGDTAKSIVVKNTGSYFVQFQLDSAYKFISDTVQVQVTDIPAKPSISRIGDTLRSSNTVGNIWYKNTTQLLDTNNRIKPTQSDYYTVKVAMNGCVSLLSQPYYYILTGIGMLNNNETTIHPNPFVDQVYIDNRFNSPGRITLEVINISNGQKVKSIELLNNMNKISLPTLASGLYLFNVMNASGTILHQQKLIKL